MLDQFPSSTRPIWPDTAVIPKYSPLTGMVSVDVCIVGAGITGLTAADLLKRAGKTVAVIDFERVGSGETSHTTAHLTEVFDLSYVELLSKFGQEGASLAAQSMRRAIERIEQTSSVIGIDCDLERVSGYRFAESRIDVDQLEEDAAAALRIGVPNTLIFDAPLPFRTSRAIRFDHQAQFNPSKYLAGLARSIQGGGSAIYEDTRMIDIEEGEPCRVHTDRGIVVADDVFVAANVPSSNRFFLHTKIAAYRTYAIAAIVNHRFDFKNLYWDVADPYHYIRSYEHSGVPMLIIGGEDHKTGHDVHTDQHFKKLIQWANERFDVELVTHHWSGQIIEPVDGLPYIGRNPLSEHIYVATGFSGTGITFGTVAGMLISDTLLGVMNPWAELYDAGRVKPFAGLRSFVSENIDYPSHMITDRLTPPDADSTKKLRENEGAIVRIGAKKVAAYRDPGGELHVLSPVCPHLGCYVHWNEAEKSWDCPCHGSRFSPVGKLLNGPAVSDLASEEYDEQAPMIAERYDQTEVNPPGGILFGPPIISLFTCPMSIDAE